MKKRYITGYAGLRALAVIGVILYHLDPDHFGGGYLGVPVFLVLTGYLVTNQIMAAYRNQGYFDIKSFYQRRFKRLYPPLIAMLWLTSAYIVLFQRNLLNKLYQIVASNLLGVYNWWQIFNGQSYFERFANNESPFTHLWTIAIDWQFYLLWPLVMALLVKFAKKRRNIFWVLVGLSVLSALEMALLFRPGQDTSRIYYGTDTRFFSLGLGSAMAVLWPFEELDNRFTQKDGVILNWTGLATLFGMLLLMFSPLMNAQTAFPYYGGMFIFSFFVTVFAAVIAAPVGIWNRLMTNPVFNWLGSRSYEIYLYQFPVMIFFESRVSDLADHVTLYRVIEIVLILLISEITYRLFEKRRYTSEGIRYNLTKLFQWPVKLSKNWLKTAAFFLVFLIGSSGIIFSPLAKADNKDGALIKTINDNSKQQAEMNKKALELIKSSRKAAKKSSSKKSKQTSKAKTKSKTTKSKSGGKKVNQEFEKYGISQADLQAAQKLQVTAIGDSVMASSSDILHQLLPHAVIDATVSRQADVAPQLLQSYAQKGELQDNVLIGLGTNGPFTDDEVKQIMQIVGPKRQLFWINVVVPTRSWQNQVNQQLQTLTKKYKNLTVIDWYGYAHSQSSWFYDDKTHPNNVGQNYYSTYIVKEMVRASGSN
ncbi:acyltransferase [Lactobacillus delbrueckii]|uniref:acyltransferase family protein n=1 Tax=Lactobacillus delbrueckii TaxID=1584 RepID=UPI001E61CF59|nr:acyltransferase family protein [Lactobacillus delbrueckii]MCD5598375.1 acetyltransferase [Lactobacillus delbrueckii subsp. lactis]GHN19579.1 acyltransferase [Lactobacillus delbrueckii]GHN22369.1 acyltransferase [Lactobacillus delbrueckii]GHN61690.1 acyltransferase [Lactobacillus delbrueckii]